MGLFSKGKGSSKDNLKRLRRIERRSDRRHAKLEPKIGSMSRPAKKQPHGWFF
jgi:hypothetical protein